jgi:NhaP-type Na+/H+ and K+/H+ antiporter
VGATERDEFLRAAWRSMIAADFGRILTAALTALIVVYALRLWAMGFGLGLVTFWDRWALRLLTF